MGRRIMRCPDFAYKQRIKALPNNNKLLHRNHVPFRRGIANVFIASGQAAATLSISPLLNIMGYVGLWVFASVIQFVSVSINSIAAMKDGKLECKQKVYKYYENNDFRRQLFYI